ncbi:hypothetical protein LNQ03_32945 [Klebsiella pneumoniae subsp. pneumoniae]|nr:hypothetical protein [Klebsiella pneumoniae subsp. pneumoniae]
MTAKGKPLRHLREVIGGGDEQRYSRVVFNEITKNAIRQAFESRADLNIGSGG